MGNVCKVIATLSSIYLMIIVLAIYCFKKALFLIHSTTVRFGATSPPPFPIPNTSQVPVFTDNVLPSLLVHLGVIDLSSSSLSSIFPEARNPENLNPLLAEAPPKSDADKEPKAVPIEGPVLTVDQAFVLRAAAIDACELIIDIARSLDTSELAEDLAWIKDITLPQLDIWLWAVAKDRPDYRKLQRFVLRDTIFF